MLRCVIRNGAVKTDAREFISPLLPDGSFARICIKPNWVKHQERDEFPITALVTSPEIIAAAIDACLEKYVGVEEIVVGDIPLQNCDWQALEQQAGIATLRDRYSRINSPRIRFVDLRREAYSSRQSFMERVPVSGDPEGYRQVTLGDDSFLDEVTHPIAQFRVSDYSAGTTSSAHRAGLHKYLVSGSVLGADLFINLPKMKTHQKAGLTGALKNLVGINGEKAYLAHYRAAGAPTADEFMPGTSSLVILQTRLRERFQKQSATTFRILKFGWEVLRRARGIKTIGTRENLNSSFYLAGGAWYGNDTIWRMTYDLNRIIRFANRDGILTDRPQREYLAIVDGITAGEGNGPLQPLPVNAGVLVGGNDPFLVDLALSRLMGFDYRRIPTISRHQSFSKFGWGNFGPESTAVTLNGAILSSVLSLTPVHQFLPPPGWMGHVELAA
jgi:uncharacterized protein (DUF362 family)